MNRSMVFAIAMALLSSSALAQDMPGSADHELIPRVAGSQIKGFAKSDYDVASFVRGFEKSKPLLAQPEGTRTRILYLAKPGDSSLKVQKNYEAALAELGDVEEVFRCQAAACAASPMVTLLWNSGSMIETFEVAHPFYLLGFSHVIKPPTYRYARVIKDGVQLHVGVFTAEIAENNSNSELRGLTAALVEILEVKDFEPTLEFVDASEMQQQIDSSGHIALYGIHFDHDKATLQDKSADTIAEIVTVLKKQNGLALYVVGHTDGIGALPYNQDLSTRRARTVVDALVAAGIESMRLTPIGVGPAAPVASNDSDEGRALNRRVELVKRHQ